MRVVVVACAALLLASSGPFGATESTPPRRMSFHKRLLLNRAVVSGLKPVEVLLLTARREGSFQASDVGDRRLARSNRRTRAARRARYRLCGPRVADSAAAEASRVATANDASHIASLSKRKTQELADTLRHLRRWEQGLPDEPATNADIAPFRQVVEC